MAKIQKATKVVVLAEKRPNFTCLNVHFNKEKALAGASVKFREVPWTALLVTPRSHGEEAGIRLSRGAVP